MTRDTEDRNRLERTPLPVVQLSVLLLLRFCESASTSVIFPFLEEVGIVFASSNLYDNLVSF